MITSIITNEKFWDVRVPPAVRKMFDRRKPYYWKINKAQAEKVLHHMAEVYHIPPPKVVVKRGFGANAMYSRKSKTVTMWARNHIKSIFHEFYHHLDNMTGGAYDSNDRRGGKSSLSWQFADHCWARFKSNSYSLAELFPLTYRVASSAVHDGGACLVIPNPAWNVASLSKKDLNSLKKTEKHFYMFANMTMAELWPGIKRAKMNCAVPNDSVLEWFSAPEAGDEEKIIKKSTYGAEIRLISDVIARLFDTDESDPFSNAFISR